MNIFTDDIDYSDVAKEYKICENCCHYNLSVKTVQVELGTCSMNGYSDQVSEKNIYATPDTKCLSGDFEFTQNAYMEWLEDNQPLEEKYGVKAGVDFPATLCR